MPNFRNPLTPCNYEECVNRFHLQLSRNLPPKYTQCTHHHEHKISLSSHTWASMVEWANKSRRQHFHAVHATATRWDPSWPLCMQSSIFACTSIWKNHCLLAALRRKSMTNHARMCERHHRAELESREWHRWPLEMPAPWHRLVFPSGNWKSNTRLLKQYGKVRTTYR